jgi:hypothetical protein
MVNRRQSAKFFGDAPYLENIRHSLTFLIFENSSIVIVAPANWTGNQLINF